MQKLFYGTLIVFAVGFLALVAIAGFYLFDRTEGSYFDSDGVKIHYTVEGEGEPVILVHGFAVNADMNWRKQGINRMLRQHHFKVIALDNRGHGYSGKPHDPEAYGAQMAKDVVNLMDHLGIDKAHLVGYSLGGFISLKCAVTYPDRWKTITIMGSAWENYKHGRAFKALQMVDEAYHHNGSLGAAMDYFEGKKSSRLIVELVVNSSALINDEEALSAVIQGLDGLIIKENALGDIKVPVCGIVGDEDPFFESAQAMKGKIPDFEFTAVEGGDHLSTPRKKKAKQALLNFLEEHLSR